MLEWVVQYTHDDDDDDVSTSSMDDGQPIAQLLPSVATNIPSNIAAQSICNDDRSDNSMEIITGKRHMWALSKIRYLEANKDRSII